ncbi:MAG: ATP-binding protein, partial [Bacilli bacterium]|nr:ATP-binding protein [Bacilli bacterium]
TRPLKQCLLIDASGKIREMELITAFMQTFINDELELKMPDGTFKYSLKDLRDAFDFALIAEGVLKSDKVYDDANVLKVRLHSLVNSDYSIYFDVDEYVSREQYIRNLLTAENGRKAQIINFNINYVDDRFAKNITKMYSKLLFDYAKNLEKRASLPFHIILEEAHRYVQNDSDVSLIGYNIFDRITKEGRKYGVLLGLISQRPSELSETCLSQCSNFLIFKMLHPLDVDYIQKMVPNITNEVVKRLRILQPGTCIAFGNAFKIPVLIKLPMPNPAPASSSCDISGIWFVERKRSN